MRKVYAPRPYQAPMTDFILERERGAVWSFMGSGKTVGTLTALEALSYVESAPTLVVAPLRVAQSTWPEEALKWDHLSGVDVVPIVGSMADRERLMKRPAGIYTTNYENIPWLVEKWGARWPYRTVVLDESTKVKGYRTKQGTVRSQALATVAHRYVKRLIELTGTPAPNGLKDLWGQAWFLDKGERLGRTYTDFQNRWFGRAFDGYGVVPFPHSQREIQDRLQGLCLTIDAKDYFDLNEPIVSNRRVYLTPKVRKLYTELENEFFLELESGHKLELFAQGSRSQKLLQCANGALYVDKDTKEWVDVHDAKIEALDEIVEDANGAPVLVAYNFKSDLARIRRAFPTARVLDKNPQTIVDWNAGKIRMLLTHPASAGHGLNLQDGGNILVYFGHNWNLEERQQIAERIGPVRQFQAGHERPVFIYNIIADDTMDEIVIESTKAKASVQDLLLAAMKRRKAHARLYEDE